MGLATFEIGQGAVGLTSWLPGSCPKRDKDNDKHSIAIVPRQELAVVRHLE